MTNKRYKIVYIGAGSFRFSIPCAMNVLDFANEFNPLDLWLVDIDQYSLPLIANIYRRMVQMHKKNVIVHETTKRRKALANADYVLISISVGMQESEWYDIHVPLKYGLPQNTGDTVGPGGIFRGLRSITLIVDMMKDIRELCPNAVVINYTNPQGFITLAALQAAPKIQAFGMCHENFYLAARRFGKILNFCGVDTSTNRKFCVEYGGLNHFAWITKFEYDGADIYPKLREKAQYLYETGKFGRTFNFYLLAKYNYLCYVEDRHVAEFLPQYYNYFNHWEKPFGITELRSVAKVQHERRNTYMLIHWLQHYHNLWIIKLFLRSWGGGERALLIAKDNENGFPKHHVCNVLNRGIIPSLPENCAIEIPCYMRDRKLVPVKVGALPNPINDWVKVHAEVQQMVVDAALSGNKDLLLKALLKDPMCAFIEDDDKIEALMNHMLYFQRRWLPKFANSIPSLTELKRSKYYIDKSELKTIKLARTEKFKPEIQIKEKVWRSEK